MNTDQGFQMRVTLTVIEGQDKGRTFDFIEQDNFLLGRNAQGTQAHFRLNPNDGFVSRNHFLVEINPPDCFLRDAGSLNGTFVVRRSDKKAVFFLEGRQERNWSDMAKYLAGSFQCRSCSKVEEKRIRLADGDIICVGDTMLEVKITSVAKEKGQVESFQCIHCGIDITEGLKGKKAANLVSSDLICEKCSRQKAKNSVSIAAITCWGCKRELTILANADGRSEELQDVALYWCDKCASSMKEPVPMDHIGDYQILKEIGSGGFGIVYLGRHDQTGRIVALKLTKDRIKKDESLLIRFKKEIAIMKRLDHPNLVKLLDDGIFEDEYYYFASEYLPDGSLSDLLQKRFNGKMPYKDACSFVCLALEGLSYFHKQKGYVHRDLKPDNILVRKNDNGKYIAKVGDFGLSRSYVLHGGTITKEGDWAGTIFFCPPEQITNFKHVKPCSDVYAMGISLYFLITGEFPYDFPRNRQKLQEKIAKGENPRQPIDIVLGNDKPMPIEQKLPGIPKKLAKAINKAIDKDASKRFASAEEFKNALQKELT